MGAGDEGLGHGETAASDGLGGRLTRRRLLTIGGAAAAAGALGPLARPLAAAAAGGRWPSGALSEADALNVDASQFMPERQLASWLRELEHIGPSAQKGLRATGSPQHEHYIDKLAERLERAGVQQVQFESVPMLRWTAHSWSLNVIDGAAPGPVDVASYIPYSGQTRRHGVTAPMVLVPSGSTPAPGSLVGKIAVFDVPFLIVPNAYFTSLAYPGKEDDPRGEFPPGELFKRSWLTGVGQVLEALQQAGASAVVGVIDYPPEGAHGSYFPYDGEITELPGLYVDRVAGAALKQQAGEGATATLALPAQIKQVTTRNVIGFIPGASNELVTLHSHSDGVNALEEDGPTAIVAMAQYLARLPANALPCTIMILLTSGHFAGGVGARAFRARHAEDLVLNTNAAVTLEHLGALQWDEQPDETMGPTGLYEYGGVFVPRTEALVNAAYNALLSGDAAPASVLHPTDEDASGTANEAAWPGEGQYLFASGGMPDANYITGPTYLVNWGISTREKIDVGRLRAEAIGFTNMVLELTRTPREQLRTINLS